MQKILLASILLVAAGAIPLTAGAHGCIQGAAVGGIAGHVAGHHAVAGAAIGCVVGHHRAKDNARQAKQAQTAPPASPPQH